MRRFDTLSSRVRGGIRRPFPPYILHASVFYPFALYLLKGTMFFFFCIRRKKKNDTTNSTMEKFSFSRGSSGSASTSSSGTGTGTGSGGRVAVVGVTRSVRLRKRGNSGFGFSLRGGREHAAGFYVSEVQPGGEAHRNGLRVR